MEQIQLVWKNQEYEYSIPFVTGIDLSCNFLSQAIPQGITTLPGLRSLNLSRNNFSGNIPRDIGNLALLESLDLSWNHLNGEIPLSLADLKALSTLNLSNNGLSGRIPTGSQLQTLDDPSIYSNNPGLCGSPLKECANNASVPTQQNEISNGVGRETLWLLDLSSGSGYHGASYFARRNGDMHSSSTSTTCKRRSPTRLLHTVAPGPGAECHTTWGSEAYVLT